MRRFIFAPLRGRRRSHSSLINLYTFYRKYDHLWHSLEPSLDKLVTIVARRHVGGVHVLERQSASSWLINVNGATQNNTEMIADAIQEEVLLILEREAYWRDSQQACHDKPAKNNPVYEDGSTSRAARRCAAPADDGDDPFNSAKPLFFRANIGAAHRKGKKERPPLMFDAEGNPMLPPGLQLSLRPILYRGNEGMTAFLVTPQLIYADHLLEDHDTLPEDAPIELMLELDLRVLQKARDVLIGLKVRGVQNRKVICPLHYRILEDKAACAAYLDACRALPEDLRAVLGIEIHHVPAPWYAPTLAPLLSPVKAAGLLLFVRATLDRRDAQTLIECGVAGVGISFADISATPQLEACAKKFVQIASRQRLRTLACGLNDDATAKIAETAGFGRLSGDVVQIKV